MNKLVDRIWGTAAVFVMLSAVLIMSLRVTAISDASPALSSVAPQSLS